MNDELDDSTLLHQLRTAASALDPPPASLRDKALRAQGWDLGIAELVADVEIGAGAGALRDAASADAPRVRDFDLRVANHELLVTLEEDPAGGPAITVSGLAPPGVDRLWIVGPLIERIDIVCSASGSFSTTISTVPISVAFTGPETSPSVTYRTPLLGFDS